MCNSTRYRKGLLVAGVSLIVALSLVGVTWAVEAGDKAPDFKLPSTNGMDVSLSDYRGKKYVLMEFYGAAFVPT